MQIVLPDVLLLCAAQVLVQLQVGCRKWGCAGAEIGGFHHHLFERKEHVPVWQVEEMGMMSCEVQGSRCAVRGAKCKCKVQGARSKVQGARCKVQGADLQGAKCTVRGAR